jgi:multiple sugar transport system substrate-binding protein
MSKKYLIIGGIVLVFILILVVAYVMTSGEKAPPQQRAELVWWKVFDDSDKTQELINDYQGLNKNVTIRYVKKDVATYEQELIDALASGRGPDILTVHNDWLPKHKDILIEMPANMMTERQYRETFLDVAGEDFISDGKIYAIPLSVDVLALYYNKDIFNSVGISEPPKTWSDVASAAQKITSQDRNGDFIRSGIAMGSSSNVNRAADILALLMLQNGTVFYDQNKTISFDNQQIEALDGSFNPASTALDFYTQFANPGKRAYTWNAKADNSVDAFSQNKLGMMISYSYMRERIIDKAPNLNWGVAAIPQVDNSGNKINFANYWGEGVSKSSKSPQAAWDFLRFISQKEVLAKYYAKREVPASRKDMIASQYSDIELGVFAENALIAKSMRKEDANRVESILLNTIDDVVLRNASATEAVRNAAQQMRLIPKN